MNLHLSTAEPTTDVTLLRDIQAHNSFP